MRPEKPRLVSSTGRTLSLGAEGRGGEVLEGFECGDHLFGISEGRRGFALGVAVVDLAVFHVAVGDLADEQPSGDPAVTVPALQIIRVEADFEDGPGLCFCLRS